MADLLFGGDPLTGKLPYTWPRSMDQHPSDFANLAIGEDGPLIPYGHGLEKELTDD